MEDLASYIRRAVIAGKEHIRRCNLNRLASSLHGNFQAELCRLLIAESGWNQRHPYRPRCYTIHAYSSVHQIKRKPSGEGNYGAFCGRVIQQLWTSLVCHYRCGVDYGTPLPHVLQSMPKIRLFVKPHRFFSCSRYYSI